MRLCLVVLSVPSAAEAIPRLVETSTPRELQGGEHHDYRIALKEDDFLHLKIEQMGIDVVVEAIGPDGDVLVEVDSPAGRRGREVLTLIATSVGEFQVRVRSLSAEVPPGKYLVHIEGPRSATLRDRQIHAAETRHLQAFRTGLPRNTEAYKASSILYREVAAEWHALGETEREADAQLRLGTALRVVGPIREAIEALQRSQTLYAAAGKRHGEAQTFNQLALAAWKAHDAGHALEACRAALNLWQDIGDPARMSATLNTYGLILARTARYDEAREAYRQVLEIATQQKDLRTEGVVSQNMAGILVMQGDPVAALEHFDRALEIARLRGKRTLEAGVLHNIGETYFRLGLAREALKNFSAALPILEETGNRNHQANTLRSLGNLHAWLRNWDQAIEDFSRALEIERAREDIRGQAWNLLSLGVVYTNLEQHGKSIPFLQKSLELIADIDDPQSHGSSLTRLGEALVASGRPDEAMEFFDKAHAIYLELEMPHEHTVTMLGRGKAHAALGQIAQAENDLKMALKLSREMGSQRRQGMALKYLAQLARIRGNRELASRYIREALVVVHSLRSQIAGHDLRSSYFTSVREIHDLAIDLLIEHARENKTPHRIAKALEVAESARAQSLVDQLREARLDGRGDVDPELLEREERLRLELNDKAVRQRTYRSATATREQADALDEEIAHHLRQLEAVQAEIHAASPRWERLTRSDSVRVADLQRDGLDDNTVLLEFFLGEARSFVWTVTRHTLDVHTLPPRAEIESLVRQVYRDLSDPSPQRSPEQRQAMERLAQQLLTPLKASPETFEGKRLAIVADGALEYLPFAALPLAGEPLIVHHELVHLPSATFLTELRAAPAEVPASGTLAILADPVFKKDDPRLAAARVERPAADAQPARTPVYTRAGLGDLQTDYQRLPFTQQEAEAILGTAKLHVPEHQLFLATGFDSRVETVTSGQLRDYRIVHFATHGELDSERPGLSALVLSLVDANGQPRDGFLRLHDVYALDLNAELVVLSGCRTALGREVLGEGLQSLTRGFFHAGASRVLASLWSVQDQATAELMRRFYRALFEDGLEPAAALRRAQLSMWRENRFRDPFYWSPFILQGEWRTMEPLTQKARHALPEAMASCAPNVRRDPGSLVQWIRCVSRTGVTLTAEGRAATGHSILSVERLRNSSHQFQAHWTQGSKTYRIHYNMVVGGQGKLQRFKQSSTETGYEDPEDLELFIIESIPPDW